MLPIYPEEGPNAVPLIIEDDIKTFYYRGLKEWQNERGYLHDTCLSAQDKFRRYPDYFRTPYVNEVLPD